VEERIRWF